MVICFIAVFNIINYLLKMPISLNLGVFMNYKLLSSNNGIGRLTALVLIIVLVVGFYFGRQVVRFYYDYYEFLGLMEAQAKHADFSNDVQIKKKLVQFARTYELPIEDLERDIQINRNDKEIAIESSYQEVLYFDLKEIVPGDFIKGDFDWDLYTFDFNPKVRVRIR